MKMTKVQKKRMLRVARALRESPNPKGFTMSCYVDPNFCGTPACALGHYGSRRDLQKTLKVQIFADKVTARLVFCSDGVPAYYDDEKIMEHFGIDYEQTLDLFGPDGCGKAKTPAKAADFIEDFVLSN